MTDSRTPKKRGRIPDHEWVPAFLGSLRKCPNVSYACRLAEVPRQTAYDRRAADPDFAAQWDDALIEGGEALEFAAVERAYKSSDTLMIFLLKGIFPDKYRDRRDVRSKVEHSGKVEAPGLTLVLSPDSDGE